jgi:hypothetical protein
MLLRIAAMLTALGIAACGPVPLKDCKGPVFRLSNGTWQVVPEADRTALDLKP